MRFCAKCNSERATSCVGSGSMCTVCGPCFRRVPCTAVLAFVSRYQVLSTWYLVPGMILLLYQEYTLYGIHIRPRIPHCCSVSMLVPGIAYHGYTMSQVSGMIMYCCGLLLYVPGLTTGMKHFFKITPRRTYDNSRANVSSRSMTGRMVWIIFGDTLASGRGSASRR